ncbi:MAG: LON peptidase substrate-binding domain-containing protein [Myxococcales bacterium]|nr:LON peptidase substrate-binding domain-containing protein [Myxococcales bacterium]
MEENVLSILPILPVKRTVLFPGVMMPLTIGRERSVAAVNAAICVTRSDGSERMSVAVVFIGAVVHPRKGPKKLFLLISCGFLPRRRSVEPTAHH